MSRWLPRSLFLRMLAAFAVVGVVAASVAALSAIRAGRGPLEELVAGELSLRARFVLEAVDRYLADRSNEVRTWSGLSLMDDVLIGDRSLNIQNLLLELRREHGHHYRTLTVLDRTELVVASSDVARVGRPMALAGLSLQTAAGGGLGVGPFPGAGSPRDSALLLAHPVRSRLATDLAGWLVAEVRWDPVVRIVAGAEIGGQAQDAGRFLLLADGEGHVLAAPPGVVAAVPTATRAVAGGSLSGVSTLETPERRAYLVARWRAPGHDTVPGRDLLLAALWDRDEALAVVRIFVSAALGSALVGLVLAVALSFGIARGITRRVSTLTEGTARLAGGDLAYRVEEGDDDEVGHLARSFNNMAEKLASARRGLEDALARWRALVTHAPDTILTVDADGTVLFANRPMSEFGTGGAVGSGIFDCLPGEHRESLRRALAEVFSSGDERALELRWPAGSGSAWVSIRMGPIRRDGRITGATLIATDVTERKRLEREVLEVSENERQRIGQDLHDGLGQVLGGTSLLSRGLQQRLARAASGEAHEAGRIADLIDEAIEQTRSLARGLFPVTLQREGLQGALEEMAAHVESVSDITCRVEGQVPPVLSDRPGEATHVFRIVQEALNNALRHSGAGRLLIRFAAENGRNVLTIEDDGCGFGGEPEGRGIGLSLMRYRAGMIGASFDIRPRPEGGTAVVCRF